MKSPAQQAVFARCQAAARRKQKGEGNNAAKLTDELVKKIRRLRAEGLRPTVLAERFNVDRGVIWRVVNRRAWSHV